nr:putative sporulation protein YtxC [Paenibacillus hamazuiensis]
MFSITLMSREAEMADMLTGNMEQALAHLHIGKDIVQLSKKELGPNVQINGVGVLPVFQLGEHADMVYRKVAECIADLILLEQEDGLVQKMIQTDYGYHDKDDIEAILAYCRQMLHGAEDAHEQGKTTLLRRKNRLTDAFHKYLQEHTDLNLQGFVRFRLHEYLEELREVVEYSIDEFVMDKQYQEFISLLKYFVYIQEAKIPVAHLIHQGGNDFTLLGDNLEPIDTSDFDATLTVEMIEKDINFEDMIVSTLITVSPQKIFIHTREPEVQVIHTILQIFEQRAEVCSYCKLCKALLGEPKGSGGAFQLGEHS